ncbi:ATP-binding protein [Stenotrophomonas sp. HITSZ_GD]|uniref:ATP-binding protein n=1 Tax=Stenotrophomonas sp. HITSZ_GD TaxID=3037248 RepID=UPI00240D75D4|nr:ATP-binding protein [Stenotrophomonas sp. HITSZ_GD]MDG2523900.1 ATP-binding protein [Stenotrophomonas sp. HITSZ_GD]
MRHPSLKLKLLKTLMAVILGGWLIWLACQHQQVSRQQSRQGDLLLRQVAEQVLMSMPRNIAGVGSAGYLELPPTIEAAPSREFDKLRFQVWSLGTGERVVSSRKAPTTPLKPDFRPGFGNVTTAGDRWRVYAVTDSEGRVQVQVGLAQSQVEAELAHWIRVSLVSAVGVLLAFALAIWLAVSWSLRSTNRLRDGMAAREPLDLTPLPTAGIAREILPLVRSFNELLGRLGVAMQRERQFLAEAAHEIRTPLAALQTQTELAMRATDPAQTREALQRLHGGIERITRLAQQLLDSARLEASRHEGREAIVELSDVATMVAREFEAMAMRRGQTLALTIEEARVCADIDDLGILLRNLVDNAVRYCGEGGRIEICCHADRAAGEAVLRVRDDGPGVPEHERARIFDRFFRGSTGNGERGSGVGLSLVARIARHYGARIDTGPGLQGRGLCIAVRFALQDEGTAA